MTTDTVAEKLLVAVAVTLTGCPATPAVNVTLVGATLREKSGVGDGVGAGAVVELECDPPHETSDSENKATEPRDISQETCETRNTHPIRPKIGKNEPLDAPTPRREDWRKCADYREPDLTCSERFGPGFEKRILGNR